jgi:3' exoribonuclease, RNase T-like
MTRYFLDTEFIEDGKTIDLISIGIVCEDGREYYAINYDCDRSKANNWVQKNVLKFLPPEPLSLFYGNKKAFEESEAYKQGWRNKPLIVLEILEFVRWSKKKPHFAEGEKPEFWGYYASYDWVAFCQLWGKMINLPKGFPMYINDIKQLCKYLGDPELPKQGEEEHHALSDAKWNKKAWEFLDTKKVILPAKVRPPLILDI